MPDADVLQHLLRSSPYPLVCISLNGDMPYRSAQALEVLGLKAGTADRVNLFDITVERDHAMLRAHLERVIINQQSARCEIQVCRPDLTRVAVRLISTPGGSGQSGEPGICWAVMENISQVRHLEKIEALYQRASEIIGRSDSIRDFSHEIFELLRILFGVENGYVALRDEERDFIRFPYFLDSRDPYPERRRTSEGLTDYVISTGRLFWLRDAQTEPQGRESRIPIHGTVPSDWIGVPLTSKGQVIGMVAIQTYEKDAVFSARYIGLMLGVANLFEIFLARVSLEQQQNMLSEAVEQADETILITDTRGIIQYVNPAFEEKTGYTRDEAVGQPSSIINSGKQDADYYREMWAEIQSGRIWRGRFVNRKKDGTLFEEDAVISPIRNKEGEITNFIGVKRDLTRETAAGQDGASARQLEVAARLVESIRHDFSNLLLIIRTHAEDLRRRQQLPDGGPEASAILESVDAAERLVQNLGDVFSQDAASRGVTRLNELLLAFEPAGRRLVGEKNTLKLALAPRMEPVRVNWKKVEQALCSLLMRAASVMPEGGEVGIRTLVAPARRDDAFFYVEEPPAGARNCAVIEVSDTGVPAPRAVWREMFQSRDPRNAAGLTEVGDIMSDLHGYIGVRENMPTGMIIRLYFPALKAAHGGPVSLEKPRPELPRGSETILLAEDDEGARRVIARMLEEQGYTVLEAENGAMAVRFLLSRTDRIHLLLTDMMMPDFDGRALSDQSRSLQPGMKVMFISGYDRSDLESGGMLDENQNAPLLKKPFKREELLRLVRETLDASSSG